MSKLPLAIEERLRLVVEASVEKALVVEEMKVER